MPTINRSRQGFAGEKQHSHEDRYVTIWPAVSACIISLKTDSRGRITLPPRFRSENLFEYKIEGDQIILYPVRTVRKYPEMSGIPEEELSEERIGN